MSWHQQEPKLSLQFIHNSNVGLDDQIIDVGGGTSLLVDYLIQSGYQNISVLDLSEHALAKSKERLGDISQNINWYATDITEFKPTQHFSLWHDRAVFHFLTSESDRKHYLQVLNQSLRPGGQLIIATFSIGGPEKCSGLDVVQYDAAKLGTELGEDFALIEEADEMHLTPLNIEQKFTYFRFSRKPHTIES